MSPLIIITPYRAPTIAFSLCEMSTTPTATETDIVVNPQCLFWQPGGSRLFVFEGSTNRVHQYPVSTPYDISTLGVTDGFGQLGRQGSPRGIWFNSTGTKVYLVGEGNDVVYTWSLDTAWDIAGSVLTSLPGEDFTLTASTNTTAMTFNPTGTKLHTLDDNTSQVHQYPVSTPFDLSTAGAKEAFFAYGFSFAQAMEWSADGKRLFIADRGADVVKQYPISSPFDIATIGTIDPCTLDVSSGGDQSTGMVWDDVGSKLHMVFFDTDDLVQFELV